MEKLIEHRPQFTPFGGRRGPMYLADLQAIVRRAAYRHDWHYHHGVDRKRYQGLPTHLVGVIVGDPEKSFKLNAWEDQAARVNEGLVGNVKVGMIPEWTHTYEDEEAGIYCHGWKPLLVKWINQRWIKATPEIQDLLGRTISLALRPKARL